LQVADYDGDFVADLAAYRRSMGWWLTTARRGGMLGGGKRYPDYFAGEVLVEAIHCRGTGTEIISVPFLTHYSRAKYLRQQPRKELVWMILG